MFGYGPGGWWDNISHVLWGIGSFFVGVIVFLIWLAILLLLVRFLLIGTRAAKLYLRSNGAHDGLLPPRAPAPAAPAAAPAATTPAATTPAATTTAPTTPTTRPVPRPRTPKP